MITITLDLVVKSNWYDMIESDIKKEEYREVKPFWIKRLIDNYEMLECNHEFKHFDAVRFHRGYTNKACTFKLRGITIGKGNPEWGAPDKEVFILKLGDSLS